MNTGGLTAETIAKAEAALRTGNALLCHDLITRASQFGLHPPELAQRLDYLAILSLAHCGSTQRALSRYHGTQRPHAGGDQDWLALEGRLFKDLARQGGAGAQFMYGRAAESYWQAFRQTGGYFSAINAATMFMLSGDADRAQALAREVLAQTGDLPGAGELERYNLLVSRAEAALLLDELDVCRAALRSADALARHHRTARARTVQQLQLICQHRRLSKTIPTLLTVPPRLFVHRDSEFDAALLPAAPAAHEAPVDSEIELAGATTHIALLDPVDVCVVEQLIDRGIHVCAVIAGTRDALSADWHARHGAGWAMRLARALERAGEVHPTRGFLAGEPRWLRQHVAAKALGLSRQSPEGIRSQWIALRIEPAAGASGFALRSIDTTQLRTIERALAERHCPLSEQPRQPGIQERRLCGILAIHFGDAGALDDAALARLRTRIVAPLAQAIAPHGAKLLMRRMRGHSALIVTDDAEIAARIALAAVQIHQDALAHADAPAELPQEVRLLAHMAPVSCGDDPLEQHPALFGSELAFCETCAVQVPPGSVFATEAFVAALGLVNLGAFRAEYVGESLASPSSASERLFNLRVAG